MVRECTEKDIDKMTEYLGGEPWGRLILSAVRAFGFKEDFQTVYVDISGIGQEEKIDGVYLFLHRNLVLLCRENKVDIDFLEQWIGISAPDKVAGRKDNIHIVSWLLTDYHIDTDACEPGLTDADGVRIDCLKGAQYQGEWALLTR